MDGDDNDEGGGNRFRNMVLGLLAGALGIIAIKLVIRWANGEL